MLKVGLIGCGGMGGTHAECWLALSGSVQLAAIADLSAEKARRFAEKSDAKIYRTGMELLEHEEVDIIDICLPTYMHMEHAVKAMELGRNVFIEKPVCLNEKEAQILLDTQRKTGARVQVGQVIRFWDEYAWLKREIDKNTYGGVVSASFTRLSENPRWAWENWYNDYTKSGTMALDLHVHDIDYIRYMMGKEPETIHSRAVRDIDGVIQQINTTYTFGDAVVTSEGCWNYPEKYPFTMTFRVKLERAVAVLDEQGVLTVYLENGERFTPEIEKEFEGDSEAGINVSSLGAYYNELKYFTELVQGMQKKEIAPLAEAVDSARLAWKEIELAGGAKAE